MDNYSLIRGSRTIMFKAEDMTVAKIGRIFQIKSDTVYLTSKENMAIFAFQGDRFSNIDLRHGGRYHVHGDPVDSITSSSRNVTANPNFSLHVPSDPVRFTFTQNHDSQRPSAPNPAMKTFQRIVFLAEANQGKLHPTTSIVIRFREADACVPGMVAKVQEALMTQMKRPNPCTLKMVALLTPLGRIEVSGCEAGVHNISIHSDGTLDERPSGCMLVDALENVPSELQVCADWLLSYFQNPQSLQKGHMPALHHAILLEDTFTSRVLHTLLRYVKFGETVSYKRLAEMAGNIRAARAVGGAMRRNPVPLLIPCHRVISSAGQPGNYMGGKGNHMKCWLLAHERAGGWESPPPPGGTGVRRSCDIANRPGLKDCSEPLGGSRRSDVNTEEMN